MNERSQQHSEMNPNIEERPVERTLIGGSDTIDTIERVLGEVERRLTDKIVLDDLAEHVHLSKFHLHRLMRAATGMPLIGRPRSRHPLRGRASCG